MKKNSRFFHHSEAGSGLLSALMGIGLVGILAMAMGTMFVRQNETNNRLARDLDRTSFKKHIIESVDCRVTFPDPANWESATHLLSTKGTEILPTDFAGTPTPKEVGKWSYIATHISGEINVKFSAVGEDKGGYKRTDQNLFANGSGLCRDWLSLEGDLPNTPYGKCISRSIKWGRDAAHPLLANGYHRNHTHKCPEEFPTLVMGVSAPACNSTSWITSYTTDPTHGYFNGVSCSNIFAQDRKGENITNLVQTCLNLGQNPYIALCQAVCCQL